MSSSGVVGFKEGPEVAAFPAGFFLAAAIGIVASCEVVGDKEGGDSSTH